MKSNPAACYHVLLGCQGDWKAAEIWCLRAGYARNARWAAEAEAKAKTKARPK